MRALVLRNSVVGIDVRAHTVACNPHSKMERGVWGGACGQVGSIADPGEVERPFIVQPGSSIATSLSKGEAERKHVLLVEINAEKQFRMISRPLHVCRCHTFLIVPVVIQFWLELSLFRNVTFVTIHPTSSMRRQPTSRIRHGSVRW